MFAVAALLPMMALAQANKPAASPQDAATIQQVTQRVRDFLASVPKSDPAVFQDFFADDVIYTRAAGVTITKSDIIKNIDVRAASEPQATYEADDFTVHPYSEMAVVNFRLIQPSSRYHPASPCSASLPGKRSTPASSRPVCSEKIWMTGSWISKAA
jgi:hypothetical protein